MRGLIVPINLQSLAVKVRATQKPEDIDLNPTEPTMVGAVSEAPDGARVIEAIVFGPVDERLNFHMIKQFATTLVSATPIHVGFRDHAIVALATLMFAVNETKDSLPVVFFNLNASAMVIPEITATFANIVTGLNQLETAGVVDAVIKGYLSAGAKELLNVYNATMVDWVSTQPDPEAFKDAA